jgi:hypothetical protein
MSEINWSETEKTAAYEAFKKAYEREIKSLIEEIQRKINEIEEIGELWLLHDFLSARRHQIDGKYDDRCSSLIFVLAQLLKEKLLSLEELQALDRDKLAKISALARM